MPTVSKEKQREYCKRWREKNREYDTARKIKWAKDNPEKVKKSWDLCNKKNPEKQTMYKRNFKRRKREYPQERLHNNISRLVNHCLHGRKGYRKWESIVGYTTEELVRHIEKQFKDGMSWSNYGEWHLDHKIPRAAFNFVNAEDIDFKKCWALSNLQPLWAKDNLRKHAKIDTPHQPSLAMAIG